MADTHTQTQKQNPYLSPAALRNEALERRVERLEVILRLILGVVGKTHPDCEKRERPYTALSQISQYALEGLRSE